MIKMTKEKQSIVDIANMFYYLANASNQLDLIGELCKVVELLFSASCILSVCMVDLLALALLC